MNFLWVAIGGAVGSVLRYAVVLLVSALDKGGTLAWPVATFGVNAIGCFLLGVLVEVSTHWQVGRPELKLLLGVGLLGGFTTFSTYGVEVAALADGKKFATATAVVLANNVAGIALAFAGFALARRVVG